MFSNSSELEMHCDEFIADIIPTCLNDFNDLYLQPDLPIAELEVCEEPRLNFEDPTEVETRTDEKILTSLTSVTKLMGGMVLDNPNYTCDNDYESSYFISYIM